MFQLRGEIAIPRASKSQAWAVIEGDVINVRTIADTRMKSIGAWLMSNGISINPLTAGAEIERLWRDRPAGYVECTTVTVSFP